MFIPFLAREKFFSFLTFSRGVLREADQLLIGPSLDGGFHAVTVTSVKRNRAPCRVVRAGQAATVALSGIDRTMLRRVSYSALCNGNLTILLYCGLLDF